MALPEEPCDDDNDEEEEGKEGRVSEAARGVLPDRTPPLLLPLLLLPSSLLPPPPPLREFELLLSFLNNVFPGRPDGTLLLPLLLEALED